MRLGSRERTGCGRCVERECSGSGQFEPSLPECDRQARPALSGESEFEMAKMNLAEVTDLCDEVCNFLSDEVVLPSEQSKYLAERLSDAGVYLRQFRRVKQAEEVAAAARAPYVSIIGELLTALSDLHDACEFWDDQDDPVLEAARAAIERANGTATREFAVWVTQGDKVDHTKYSFWSQAELDAFMKGLDEMDCGVGDYETFDSEEEADKACGIDWRSTPAEPTFLTQSIDQPETFWNNEYGWCDRSMATKFTYEERQTLNLPIGGKWVVG